MTYNMYQIIVEDPTVILPLIERLCIERVNVKLELDQLYDIDYFKRIPFNYIFKGYLLEFPDTSIERIKKIAADMPWITFLDMPYFDVPKAFANARVYEVSEKIPVGTVTPISYRALMESLPYLYCYQLKFLGKLYGIDGAEKMRRIKLLNALKKYLEPKAALEPKKEKTNHALKAWTEYHNNIRAALLKLNANFTFCETMRIASILKKCGFEDKDQFYMKSVWDAYNRIKCGL